LRSNICFLDQEVETDRSKMENMSISWPLSNEISRENGLGAQQNSSKERLNLSYEKAPARAGFWKRRWLHVRRHWILYSVGVFLSLAVGLPLL
jgi:hypothetical protein